MNLLFLTLHSLIPLFALIGLGYGLRRWSLLHHEHVPVLNGLVVNVLLPAAILTALLKSPPLSPRVMLLPGLLIVVEVLLLGLCWLAFRRMRGLSPASLGALMLAGTFGNTAFLGYPITQALLPRQFPTAVIVDEFGMTLLLFPAAALVGGWFRAGRQRRGSTVAAMARFLRSPLFIALVAGIGLRLLPIPAAVLARPWVQSAGAMIFQCLNYLAQATTAVVLLALGVALSPRSGGDSGAALWVACGVKLFLAPALMWALCRLAGVGGEARLIGVLQAAMPAAVMTAVLAREHGLDDRLAVRIVCVSTALSAVTIAVVLTFLR